MQRAGARSMNLQGVGANGTYETHRTNGAQALTGPTLLAPALRIALSLSPSRLVCPSGSGDSSA
jgi:hypothetical protein